MLAPAEGEALAALRSGDRRQLARIITAVENRTYAMRARQGLLQAAAAIKVPVLGITGTGGAGKSSLTDELILRLRLDQEDRLRVAVISIDPSRKRTGGALLGDRIRMNAIDSDRIFMRSLATRDTGTEISAALPEVIACCKLSGFDLVVIETSGIGQGESAIVPLVDASLYVMTPEFGAASQLEKIDMLDFADFVAINKFDRKGAEDALRDVRKQYQRNRSLFQQSPDSMPVYGTMASRFNDDGVTALYQAIVPKLREQGLELRTPKLPPARVKASSRGRAIVPPERVRYLAEIAQAVRDYHGHIDIQARTARERQVAANRARIVRGGRQDERALRRVDRGKGCGADSGKREAARAVAEDARALRRGRVRGEDPRQGDPHPAQARVALGHQGAQGRAAALRRRRARFCVFS